MQAQPQSHLAQHSAMRRRWAWPKISRQIAYMCVASTTRLSLSLSPSIPLSLSRAQEGCLTEQSTRDAARTVKTELSWTNHAFIHYNTVDDINLRLSDYI